MGRKRRPEERRRERLFEAAKHCSSIEAPNFAGCEERPRVEIPAEPDWAIEPDPERELRAHLARLERSCRMIAADAGLTIPGADERRTIDADSLRAHLWQALRDVAGALAALDAGDLARAGLAAVSATEHNSIALDRQYTRPTECLGRAHQHRQREKLKRAIEARTKADADANRNVLDKARTAKWALEKQRGPKGSLVTRGELAQQLIDDGADPKGRGYRALYDLIAPLFQG